MKEGKVVCTSPSTWIFNAFGEADLSRKDLRLATLEQGLQQTMKIVDMQLLFYSLWMGKSIYLQKMRNINIA